MTKEINTDAELISRLLSAQPTPAECLVAAARIEQLAAQVAELTRERDAVEALVKAADEAAHALSYSAYDGVQRARANLQTALAAIRKGATP